MLLTEDSLDIFLYKYVWNMATLWKHEDCSILCLGCLNDLILVLFDGEIIRKETMYVCVCMYVQAV